MPHGDHKQMTWREKNKVTMADYPPSAFDRGIERADKIIEDAQEMIEKSLFREVRTTSATGGEKGVKPERYDLIPKLPLDVVARIMGYGAEKYADHNYRKGYEWSKSYAALMRHLTAFWDGEDLDPESGLPHLGHAMFHCMALLIFAEEHPEYDDRYATTTGETDD